MDHSAIITGYTSTAMPYKEQPSESKSVESLPQATFVTVALTPSERVLRVFFSGFSAYLSYLANLESHPILPTIFAVSSLLGFGLALQWEPETYEISNLESQFIPETSSGPPSSEWGKLAVFVLLFIVTVGTTSPIVSIGQPERPHNGSFYLLLLTGGIVSSCWVGTHLRDRAIQCQLQRRETVYLLSSE